MMIASAAVSEAHISLFPDDLLPDSNMKLNNSIETSIRGTALTVMITAKTSNY